MTTQHVDADRATVELDAGRAHLFRCYAINRVVSYCGTIISVPGLLVGVNQELPCQACSATERKERCL